MLFTVLRYLQYNNAPVSDMCFRSTEVFHSFAVLSGLWLSCCEITEAAYFVASSGLSFPPSTCKGNLITLHLFSAKLNSCRISIMFPVASMLLSMCWCLLIMSSWDRDLLFCVDLNIFYICHSFFLAFYSANNLLCCTTTSHKKSRQSNFKCSLKCGKARLIKSDLFRYFSILCRPWC